jgi:hypothetical protein
MKHSWRKSKEGLMDDMDDDDDDDNVDDKSENEESPKAPKHVHFSLKDEQGQEDAEVVTEIINDDENDASPFTEEEAVDMWYQNFDFQRFEKDRLLTTRDYTNARRLNKAFVEEEHSVRGIEHLCDYNLHRRQTDERNNLYKAVKAEEARQKEEGSFPNFDRFRVVCLRHTKAGKQRAIAKAGEDAREQQREMRRSASMKNIFRLTRGQSTLRMTRRQSFG